MRIFVALFALFILVACDSNKVSDPGSAYPQQLSSDLIRVSGELDTRLEMNFNRLEEEKYRPNRVFLTNEESQWWPGDTEGRTVLALTLLSQVTGREPIYLEEILDQFPNHLNHKGYFGDIPPEGILDEQQLSSHGWVLRSLCENYEWKQDKWVLDMIQTMIDSLVIPTSGHHKTYPIDPSERQTGKGSFIGSREYKTLNNWILSTDIGCDFIFMDGVIQAYAVSGDQRLVSIIEEMIDLYLSIDLRAIQAQTHATLTGMRGLLRYFEISGQLELLDACETRFALYKSEGMTENYENYNWFGRPTHTEPCAIHDSYLVAIQLWKFTGKPVYLEDAHHIYYNGIAATQRSNGGFGCNSCLGAASCALGMKIYEAHWCCTMRGGEGLSYAATSSYFTKDHIVFIPFYGSSRADIGFEKGEILSLEQSTAYPFDEKVLIRVIENSSIDPIELRLFAPEFMQNFRVLVNGDESSFIHKNGFISLTGDWKEGDLVEFRYEMKSRVTEAINHNTMKGGRTLRYGPLLLSSVNLKMTEPVSPGEDIFIDYDGDGIFLVNGVPYSSVYHLMDPRMDDLEINRQIIF